MLRRPPRSPRADTRFPYTTPFRSTPAASELTTAPLAIVTDKGAFSFVVESARSEAEQAQGLKHRRPLAPDRGMIVPMRAARLASFWMKDTPSPLDIIFIAPGGTVARIAAMTKPYRTEERRVGNECVSTCRSRWSPYH